MRETPIDRITLRITSDPRLTRVARAAVLLQVRAWGMTIHQAAPFAAAVARRFRETARRPNPGRRLTIHLSLESGPEEFLARLAPGAGGRVWVFRTRRRKSRRVRQDHGLTARN